MYIIKRWCDVVLDVLYYFQLRGMHGVHINYKWYSIPFLLHASLYIKGSLSFSWPWSWDIVSYSLTWNINFTLFVCFLMDWWGTVVSNHFHWSNSYTTYNWCNYLPITSCGPLCHSCAIPYMYSLNHVYCNKGCIHNNEEEIILSLRALVCCSTFKYCAIQLVSLLNISQVQLVSL